MTAAVPSSVPTLPIQGVADDAVKAGLKKYQIGLTVEEARKITEMLGRDPTVVEAVIWGIQGSEHCSYKSSRRFLKMFTTTGKHVILGPSEDSGIVAITDAPKGKRWGLVVTHESHNHPSQIVPFEGAATGIGGTVRDVVCMGARVIGAMDMLRLGDLKSEKTKTIAKEVVRGIGGYGNPLGVPNLGGDTVFDAAYNNNCLVNAIALGIVREDEVIHSYVPDEAGKVGYDIILIGKPTDRSGFGGAAFASASMEADKKEQNTGAVQEPNPFLERHILASTYALFDWLIASKNLHRVSFKDLGAGGVVCASVEQVAAKGMGAEVQLEKVHVSIPDLPPEVIACAETQERLCWTCHPDLTEHILDHYNTVWDLPSVAEHARANVIGKVTESGIYHATYKGVTVCNAKATDITSGLQYVRPTAPTAPTHIEPQIACNGDRVSVLGKEYTLEQIVMAMLEHPNGASKAPAFKHFDKTVIGNTIIEAGEADAAVIAPLQDLQSYVHQGEHPGWEELPEKDRFCGVAVAADGNGRYGRISPYWQGANATIESMRNVVAVGATPRALTDCLNYGNPEIPEHLWALQEGVRGIAEAAKGVAFGGEAVPVISGNVSLYNSKPDGSAIDPTAVVSCSGVIADARKAITMQLKQEGSALLLIGHRQNECGGSLYNEVLEALTGAPRDALLGLNVPKPDFADALVEMECVVRSIEEGHVLACHDISDGGLLMTLFEMTLPQRKMGGRLGVEVDLSVLESDLANDKVLFSQTGGFVLEVPASKVDAVIDIGLQLGLGIHVLGSVTGSPAFRIKNGSEVLLSLDLVEARKTWENGLDKAWN